MRMVSDKQFYNEASAAKLGWEPEWFGVSTFDDRLTKAVRAWQRKIGLKADGLVGPMTYRRIWTERESEISDHINMCPPEKDQSFIIHNGKPYAIEWPKVVLWDEPEGLKATKGSYTSFAGHADRKPKMFVNHWDVCLNSHSCQRVLTRRGISVHYMIDNDGTIYQALDTQHSAWHAGSRKNNLASIGVEISNAYYVDKYQKWYVKNGFGERPVITNGKVHGRSMKPFLGFYDVQLDALKALWKAINVATGIPLQTPTGSEKWAVCRDAARSRYNGYVSHYHLTRKKIDCASLDIEKLLGEIK